MTSIPNDVRASASVTQLEAEGVVDARVSPLGSLENLSQREVQQLLSSGQGGVYEMFRRCALAVLASGLESDDVRAIFDRYKDFEIRLGRQAWGVKLEIRNAPASAFVDGSMIRGSPDCSTLEPTRKCGFHSTRVITGSRYGTTCRPFRFAICRSRTTPNVAAPI